MDLFIKNYCFAEFLDEMLDELDIKKSDNPKKEKVEELCKNNSSFEVRTAMIKYFETLGIVRGNADKYIEITKKQVYEAIGMKKPTQAFNNAWSALSRNEFIGYDKESKKWIWL